MKRIFAAVAALLALTACTAHDSQNRYKDGEVGVSHSVEFGTVLNVREVEITGKNTGTGTLLGAGVGAGAGSYIGKGDGNIWATAGVALAGAVAGHFAEQAMNDRTGLEYVVNMQSGETKTIVQEKDEKDTPINPGDHVMLQYCDGSSHSQKCKDGAYQRLIPVKKLPPYVKHLKKYTLPKDKDEDSAE